jgi:hypothetical protein
MDSLLSSEILEKQFGPTELEVLYQDDRSRVIATRATDSGQILELSWVRFLPAGIEKFPDTHRSVMAGLSMGKAFRADGIEFNRNERVAYSDGLTPVFQQLFAHDEAATIAAVTILAGSEKTVYAEILETYSPMVKWPNLHGKPIAENLTDLNSFGELLSRLDMR